MKNAIVLAAGALVVLGAWVAAQESKPMSPVGTASAQVLGQWVKSPTRQFAVGGEAYTGGKWIEVAYGRPLKRGRDVFGSGANYGKDMLIGAPIWRAGANVSTRLKTEAPLHIAGKVVPPGEYSLFIDLKEHQWTLVVSSWPAQTTYDPANKAALWGAYEYTPDHDVVRATMKLESLPHTREALTWEFLDMTGTGGVLAISWDKTMASVPFTAGA